MTILDPKGRPSRFSYKEYLVDWDRKVSGPQKATKDFLKQYWQHDIVLEEARCPRSLLRIDLWNVSRSIVVEVSPRAVHDKYNPFFHGSLAGFRSAIKRDMEKHHWCELNGLALATIKDGDFPLTAAFFQAQFGITL